MTIPAGNIVGASKGGSAGVISPAQGGTGTSTVFTQGSVVFAGSSGVYSQSNSNFFWDDANKALIIGNAGGITFDGTGSQLSPSLQVLGTTPGTAMLGFARFTNSSASGPRFAIAHSRGATIGSFTTLQNGDSLGYFIFEGSDGTQFRESVSLEAVADGIVSVGVVPGRFNIYTYNSSGVKTLCAAFTSAQNLELSAAITKYNNISTVARGIPSTVAIVNLTNQTASIAATTAYTTTAAGVYRVSYVATVTTAGTITSTIGPLQVRYTNANDSVVKTTTQITQVSSAQNTTATSIAGSMIVNCAAASAIQYIMTYAANVNMAYDLTITIEAL